MAMSGQLAPAVAAALVQELEQLRNALRELVAPLDQAQFWARPVDPGNSVGHLVLHLTGNLNHFVGAQLGGSGYVRDRQREFTETRVPPKAEALAELDGAVATFRRVVTGLTEQQLLAPHPEARFGSVLETLIHLVAHFALHRGQISYVARLAQQRVAG
jgi:uncharacterized damage-inducible protein DinB